VAWPRLREWLSAEQHFPLLSGKALKCDRNRPKALNRSDGLQGESFSKLSRESSPAAHHWASNPLRGESGPGARRSHRVKNEN